jgi:hypothetical protein
MKGHAFTISTFVYYDKMEGNMGFTFHLVANKVP